MTNYSKITNAHFVLSSKQTKLVKAFQSAKSVDESLKAFKAMESSFHESDLGFCCWKLAQKLLKLNRPKDALIYGKKARIIMFNNIRNNIHCFGNYSVTVTDFNHVAICSIDHNPYLFFSFVLNLLGSACLVLKRYHDSLTYFDWAYNELSKLGNDKEENRRCTNNCVLRALSNTETYLYDVKVAMDNRGNFVFHLRKGLEIKEKIMEVGCMDLGVGNKRVCEAYYALLKYEEALPFCLKALEIYTKHLGENSLEVAKIRLRLGALYKSLKEVDKVLEQYKLAISGLKCVGASSSDLITVQNNVGFMLLGADRNEEALEAFNASILFAENEGDQMTRANLLLSIGRVLLSIAREFCKKDRNYDAKKFMEIGLRILDKEEIDAYIRAIAFVDMAEVYEEMKDHEAAFSCLQRAMSTPEALQETDSYLQVTKIQEKVVASLKGLEPGDPELLKDAVTLLNQMKSQKPKNIRGPDSSFFINKK